MNWEGFAVARFVSDDELRRMISPLFGVASSKIAIGADVDELFQFPLEQIETAVERRPLKGAFALWVEIWPHDHRPRLGEMETMQEIARVLGAALLVSDDSYDPSTWLRVWPDGRIEPVSIDVDAFDDRDEVVVKRIAPDAEGNRS